ncbi:MAG TPA: ATP-binding protein [Bacteroidales bacterium]
MKIKTKLTLNFSILVAGILMTFCLTVYFFYLIHRQVDFGIRLKNKAINTATLLTKVNGIDKTLMRIIDDNTVTNMNDVTVIILDKSKNLLYSNIDASKAIQLLPDFKILNWNINDRKFRNGKLYLCFQSGSNEGDFYVLASAIDQYGQNELKRFLIILVGVLFVSLALIVFAGYYNAKQSLRPIKDVVSEMEQIKASNLDKRLNISSKDEIAELANTFDNLLERLEKAFETERMFVSNASHELRTPITSIIGQLEVGLLKTRTVEEYKATIASVLEDVKNMKNIINGFLHLAEITIEPNHKDFQTLRADELLFLVKEYTIKRRPDYSVQIEFEKLIEDESEVSIKGNSRLIRVMFSNLIDNACKFSPQYKAIVRISYDQNMVVFKFIDNGIGIPKEEISKIFNPMYRGSNTTGKAGNGIGLSIVKRIADIHGALINVISHENIGTTVIISFPGSTNNLVK